MTTETHHHQARKGRSPSYPGVDLGTAIERARQMYGLARNHPVPVNALLAQWGYSPKSGQGGVVLAALLKFGLATDEGTAEERHAQLTPDGLAIVRDQRDVSPERDALIQRLALLPAIHRELWAEYDGDLPADATLLFHLTNRRNFTDSGAADFIREFRSTVAFARLDSSATIPDEDDEQEDIDEDEVPSQERTPREQDRNRVADPPPRERKPGMTVLSFQISDRLVEVAVPGGPLTKNEITILREYLTTQEKIAPEAVARPAIWRMQDADVPVVVTGSLGSGPDGREYMGVKGSTAGVPADELVEPETD